MTKRSPTFFSETAPSAPLPASPYSSSTSFLYFGALFREIHPSAIEETCRVAREVRIFALPGVYGEPSPRLLPVIQHLRERGYAVERRKVTYEVLRGAGEMLSMTGP